MLLLAVDRTSCANDPIPSCDRIAKRALAVEFVYKLSTSPTSSSVSSTHQRQCLPRQLCNFVSMSQVLNMETSQPQFDTFISRSEFTALPQDSTSSALALPNPLVDGFPTFLEKDMLLIDFEISSPRLNALLSAEGSNSDPQSATATEVRQDIAITNGCSGARAKDHESARKTRKPRKPLYLLPPVLPTPPDSRRP